MRIGSVSAQLAPAAFVQHKPSTFKDFVQPPAPEAVPATPAGPLGASAPSVPTTLAREALTRILDDERKVDLGLRRAMAGQHLDARSLLVLQCDVMRYSQAMDLASRLVDRVAADIKQVLQTQV
jgi:hypothetical protein